MVMIWLNKKLVHVCLFTLLTNQTWHLVLGLIINKPNPKKKNYKHTCETTWLNKKKKRKEKVKSRLVYRLGK